MQKVSLKKLSILGLVLMAASAVTAAIVPSTKDDSKVAGFTLTVRSGDGNDSTVSCQQTDNVGGQVCGGGDATATAGASDTTSQDGVSSDATTL